MESVRFIRKPAAATRNEGCWGRARLNLQVASHPWRFHSGHRALNGHVLGHHPRISRLYIFISEGRRE
eukprot:scaffold536691_cov20-Prasinocladus_malaysianus.AAC.1